jgi:hypothetical protein
MKDTKIQSELMQKALEQAKNNAGLIRHELFKKVEMDTEVNLPRKVK